VSAANPTPHRRRGVREGLDADERARVPGLEGVEQREVGALGVHADVERARGGVLRREDGGRRAQHGVQRGAGGGAPHLRAAAVVLGDLPCARRRAVPVGGVIGSIDTRIGGGGGGGRDEIRSVHATALPPAAAAPFPGITVVVAAVVVVSVSVSHEREPGGRVVTPGCQIGWLLS
jgi:hypothetical protein